MTHRLPRAALLVAAVVMATGCARKADEGDKAVKAVVTASTFTATVEPFTRTISAIGTVVARPGAYASLSAPSAARIAKVYVAPGQRVGIGSTLVEFDQAPFITATNAADAALNAAQKNYERQQRLATEGIVARKDVETAAADLGKAKADAVVAQRAQQLSILRSPLNGVVTSMKAVLGASADQGQVLVEIANPEEFDVVLSLGATDAGAVLPGAKVTITAGEKSGGDVIGVGTVASVGATVDTVSRAVSIRVTIAEPKRPLRLSESVYGTIALSTRPAVVIPAQALVPGDEVGTYKVFVVDAKGMANSREVKIGGRDATRVEIVDGLKAGEKVVSQGAFGVADSAKVTKDLPGADDDKKDAKDDDKKSDDDKKPDKP